LHAFQTSVYDLFVQSLPGCPLHFFWDLHKIWSTLAVESVAKSHHDMTQSKRTWEIGTSAQLREILYTDSKIKTTNKLHGLSPRANYTDWATTACRRSYCQLLRIEGATWSVWRVPTAVFSVF
jgi:hypothetical protein